MLLLNCCLDDEDSSEEEPIHNNKKHNKTNKTTTIKPTQSKSTSTQTTGDDVITNSDTEEYESEKRYGTGFMVPVRLTVSGPVYGDVLSPAAGGPPIRVALAKTGPFFPFQTLNQKP